MGEEPSHDVVIGKHDVRHEEIVEISVHVKEPKCSPMMTPLRIRRGWMRGVPRKLYRARASKITRSGQNSRNRCRSKMKVRVSKQTNHKDLTVYDWPACQCRDFLYQSL